MEEGIIALGQKKYIVDVLSRLYMSKSNSIKGPLLDYYQSSAS